MKRKEEQKTGKWKKKTRKGEELLLLFYSSHSSVRRELLGKDQFQAK